jgi:dTDP-glucose 4,6-dehydratase
MNILITGGAGFIGSNFTGYWHRKYPYDKITVYDKLTYAGNKENLAGILDEIVFVKGDICDKEFFSKTVKENKIDTIVHFAAETHVDRSIYEPGDFVQTNIVGTYNILEVVRENPEIRFHHISTDEVFGTLSLDKLEIKFNEDTPYNPKSPYSASKAGSDHLVRAYINTYKIKATISNCSNNYGPYCFVEKLIPLAISRALNDQEIPVYGSGRQVRDWIYVEDHCRGIDLILQKGRIGETYILGGDGEKENLWIIKEILRILNKPESLIIHVEDRLGHDERYAMDYSKARKELGFEPEETIAVRLAETVKWYRENFAWWQGQKALADKLAEKYLEKRL